MLGSGKRVLNLGQGVPDRGMGLYGINDAPVCLLEPAGRVTQHRSRGVSGRDTRDNAVKIET